MLSVSAFTQKLVPDNSFTPTINGAVNFVEILSDGKILIAGEFTIVNGVTRYKIARLNADGSLDESFNANAVIYVRENFNPLINSMEVLPDGKILLGGILGEDAGLYDTMVHRLNADGTHDITQTAYPHLQDNIVSSVSISKVEQLADGKILVCGNFDSPNGNSKTDIARYNNNGTYDSTFTTTINNSCNDVEGLPDGKYLISGFYTTVNGSSRTGLTRFNSDASVDTSFNAAPLPNGSPALYNVIELLSDGRIFSFQQNGSDQILARLNADGSLQTMFPNQLFKAWDVTSQTNGKVLVAGDHRNVFGQSTDFNRYNTDGTHDPSLDKTSFFGVANPNIPKAVAVAADGKVIVGGNFTSFSINNGAQISRPYIARFTPTAIPVKPRFDFDGDGRDDMAVFRPGDRVWYLNRSAAGFSATQFGISTDIPVAADYDGDGKTDIAVWRADGGIWYWLKSSDNTLGYAIVGQPGDIPQQRNANGSASKMVFRPSDARWWVFNGFNAPSSLSMGIELTGDIPVRDDYDGDGVSDLAIFRDGNWFHRRSSNSEIVHYQFGLAGDKPVPADYDGDGRTDYAVFRPSEGVWYIKKSTEGFYAVQWGLANDLPVPADYDGDGKTDIAVYRNGVWYEMRSTNAFHIEQFGLAGDIPAQLR
jgi:uncharacterized delta-60 repeat protein